MAKTIELAELGDAITKELETYRKGVVDRVNVASEEAAAELVKKTKRTAPKRTGGFRRNIAWKATETIPGGSKKYVWYVKAPFHRLTHLLVHGHAKRNGGRVPGDPFLENALDEVRPKYEEALEEAITNG